VYPVLDQVPRSQRAALIAEGLDHRVEISGFHSGPQADKQLPQSIKLGIHAVGSLEREVQQ
jgi:hypothetical protein